MRATKSPTPNPRMNSPKVLFWSITVALGGFLFGFDTAVISGAEQSIQVQWNLSSAVLGQMVAAALYGTVIGAVFGGIPCDKLGRKRTLILIAGLYLLSAIGSALAPEIYSLMLFRFIGGLGVGASSVAAPVYIAEIAPPASRGRLTAIFQFNLVIGILIAYVSNYLIGAEGDVSWRIMLGVETIPALLFLILLFRGPESPRWLAVRKKDPQAALEVLRTFNPAGAEAEVRSYQAHTDAAQTRMGFQECRVRHFGTEARSSEFKTFLQPRYRTLILLAFLFAFFNQLSGINAIIYYAPRIFGMAGMGGQTALLSTAGIGLTNLVATLLGLYLIDRMGRRFLMYIGSVGYILSLAGVAWAFFAEAFSGPLVPILLFVFIASHAVGQGACIWVFISEIFPNHIRGYGMSLGSGTHWVFAALVAATFPFFAERFGGGPIFAFFAGFMVLQLLFVWKLMPETKGVSLEELEAQLLPAKPNPSGQ